VVGAAVVAAAVVAGALVAGALVAGALVAAAVVAGALVAALVGRDLQCLLDSEDDCAHALPNESTLPALALDTGPEATSPPARATTVANAMVRRLRVRDLGRGAREASPLAG
jgi:hypothetical protein